MQDSFSYCESLVRAADKDRFLATLFAPAGHRGAIFALYAFNIEVARVREVVREPLAGEIRLQWWNDALGGGGRGDVDANPVAAALRAAIARHDLSADRLNALIAARRFDLYDEPMATLADLEAYAEGAACGLIALVAQILDVSVAPDPRLIRHAGLAYAITGLIKAFPIHAVRGQLYVPLELLQRHGTDRRVLTGDEATPQLRAALAELRIIARRHLDQARALVAAAPPAHWPAFLPVAPVRTALARMERPDYDPYAPDEMPQWRRQWLIWRAARQPSRIFG